MALEAPHWEPGALKSVPSLVILLSVPWATLTCTMEIIFTPPNSCRAAMSLAMPLSAQHISSLGGQGCKSEASIAYEQLMEK